MFSLKLAEETDWVAVDVGLCPGVQSTIELCPIVRLSRPVLDASRPPFLCLCPVTHDQPLAPTMGSDRDNDLRRECTDHWIGFDAH